MRSFLIAACLVLFASTPALAGGGFFARQLDRAAIRQGRRQGLRDAARLNSFQAASLDFRAVHVAPVRRFREVPIYSAPVYSLGFGAAPVYSLRVREVVPIYSARSACC